MGVDPKAAPVLSTPLGDPKHFTKCRGESRLVLALRASLLKRCWELFLKHLEILLLRLIVQEAGLGLNRLGLCWGHRYCTAP